MCTKNLVCLFLFTQTVFNWFKQVHHFQTWKKCLFTTENQKLQHVCMHIRVERWKSDGINFFSLIEILLICQYYTCDICKEIRFLKFKTSLIIWRDIINYWKNFFLPISSWHVFWRARTKNLVYFFSVIQTWKKHVFMTLETKVYKIYVNMWQ